MLVRSPKSVMEQNLPSNVVRSNVKSQVGYPKSVESNQQSANVDNATLLITIVSPAVIAELLIEIVNTSVVVCALI